VVEKSRYTSDKTTESIVKLLTKMDTEKRKKKTDTGGEGAEGAR